MKDLDLATYAVNEKETLGRVYPYSSGIEINDEESVYVKDTRRILHSESFNRLRDKTQVFPVTDEKTNALSRMTHSVQVAQLSSDISSVLKLNSNIAYTLGLLHDIGHAPFGHLGQEVLNELMKNHGGFEHNFQAIRIVDKLEGNNMGYAGYEGLNLTFEVREGILKHCSLKNAENLEKETAELNKAFGLNMPNIARRHLNGQQAFLEAQLVDLCDAISYLHSDLKDAYRNGILDINKMVNAPGFIIAYEYSQKRGLVSDVLPTQKEYELALREGNKTRLSHMSDYVSKVIDIMYKLSIKDLINISKEMIYSSGIKTIEDVKDYKSYLIGFSDEQYKRHSDLKVYSRKNIYRHPDIHDERFVQADIIVGLFNAYINNPSLMVGKGLREGVTIERNIADNISGMTDKFALHTHRKIKENTPELLTGNYSLPKDFEISPDKKLEKKRLGIGN